MMEHLDNPPIGWKRQSAGWLMRCDTQQRSRLRKLEQDNKDLADRIASLEAMLGALVKDKADDIHF